MEEHRITLKTQLANLKGILLYALIFIGFYSYFSNSNLGSAESFAIGFLIAFSIQLIPLLILHINYFLTNKKDVLLYDSDKKDMIFIHNKEEVKFNLSDVRLIEYNKSFALAKKNAQFLAFDDYNHASIYLENGTRIIVTSLILPGEINIPVPAEKTKVMQNVFRWVNGKSLIMPLPSK